MVEIPIGIIFQTEKVVFEDQIPALKAGPLVSQSHNPQNFEKILKEFVP